MKYCLHERFCSSEYLKKADEIIIDYRDRRAIPDFAKKYPDAQLVLEVIPDTQWNFDEIKEYFVLAKEKLILCLPDLRDPAIEDLKASGIPFFWGYTITTFWELKAALACGVAQVRIGAPIFFQTDKLKLFNVKKRIAANIAHDGYIPNVDGVSGSWIRPEDVYQYEDIFDIIEFSDIEGKKEEALYRIYAEQKHWPGRVDMIISNITTEAYNNMLPNEFTTSRLNCGQRCAAGGVCRLCYRHLKLADPELIRPYKEFLEEKENT